MITAFADVYFKLIISSFFRDMNVAYIPATVHENAVYNVIISYRLIGFVMINRRKK